MIISPVEHECVSQENDHGRCFRVTALPLYGGGTSKMVVQESATVCVTSSAAVSKRHDRSATQSNELGTFSRE